MKSEKSHEKESLCREVYGQTDVVKYHTYWLWRESRKELEHYHELSWHREHRANGSFFASGQCLPTAYCVYQHGGGHSKAG